MVETDHYFIFLPTEPAGEPDVSFAVRAGNLHEAGIVDSRVRIVEMRGVRQVVELGSELEL
jgi:hypothetical protein